MMVINKKINSVSGSPSSVLFLQMNCKIRPTLLKAVGCFDLSVIESDGSNASTVPL